MSNQKKKAKFSMPNMHLQFLLFTLGIFALIQFLWTLQTSPLFLIFRVMIGCILFTVWYNVLYLSIKTDDVNEKIYALLRGAS